MCISDVLHFVNQFPINGHLGCFQFFLLKKFYNEYDITMTFHIYMNLSVGEIPRNGIATLQHLCFLNFNIVTLPTIEVVQIYTSIGNG